MPNLRFPLDGVRRLAAATRAAATREPTFAQRELDPAAIPVGFWLVKDAGVYLVANGDRMAHAPLYAEGLGPDADADLVREVAGGDDFVAFIPVDWADTVVEAGADAFVLRRTGETLELMRPDPGEPRGPR